MGLLHGGFDINKLNYIQIYFYECIYNSYFSVCTLLFWLLELVDLTLSLTFVLLSTGWPPSPQASAQVTYKSSSKQRARFLSGPVSLSICLYFCFIQLSVFDGNVVMFLDTFAS